MTDSPKNSDWFAGDVDCDGNELITVRKDEWNTIGEQREKFMWQVRDTCTRAEKAEAALAAEFDLHDLIAKRDELDRMIKLMETGIKRAAYDAAMLKQLLTVNQARKDRGQRQISMSEFCSGHLDEETP